MKKIYAYFIFILIILGLGVCQSDYLKRQLETYAFGIAGQQLGAALLAPEQEEKVKAIASEMGVSEPIVIRKMNHDALRLFGYCNAISYFPAILGFIPISNKPFLFISEGFFEDLSPEEQRFLIGHEMVHIKERHVLYLELTLYMLFFLLLIFWWFLKKYFRLIIQKIIATKYHSSVSAVTSCILFCICLVVPELIGFAYRRHIEREADCKSMEILKSYDGGIKLIDRWVKEFKIPAHNQYFGLLSDHPSCFERKMCCLEFKNKSKG